MSLEFGTFVKISAHALITRSLILIVLVRVPKVINPFDKAGSLLILPYLICAL